MTREHARRVVSGLRGLYPQADCELAHASALELRVATILSAQCTDARVNRVTPKQFRKYRGAQDWARAELAALEEELRPVRPFPRR